MSANDPLAYLKQQNLPIPEGAEGLDEPQKTALTDPLGYLKGDDSMLLHREPTVGKRFQEGFITGVVHPLLSAVPRPEIQEGDIAGKIGEFVGGTASFVGIAALTEGLGVPALASVGLTGSGARIAMSSLAGALFEAGSGKGLEDVPERALVGAALTGGADAALRGVAAYLRGRWAGPTLHPMAIRIEDWLAPKLLDRDAIAKLKLLGTPTMQLDIAIAKLAQKYQPDGMAILPTPKAYLKETVEALQKAYPNHLVLTPTAPSDVVNVLVAAKQIARELPEYSVGKPGFLAGGQPIHTYQEALDMMGQDNIQTFMHNVEAMKVARGQGKLVWGFARYTPEEAHLLEEGADIGGIVATPKSVFLTALHEYQHILTNRIAYNTADPSNPRIWMMLDRKLGLKTEHIQQIGQDLEQLQQVGPSKLKKGSLAREMYELTRYAETTSETWAGQHLGEIPESRWTQMKEYISSHWSYYRKDTELVSRAIEMMVMDPRKAKELAPRMTRMLARVILREEPKMRELLQQQGLSGITDILKQRWSRELGEEGITIFKPKSFEMDAARQAQYKATGYFNGMSGYVNGRPVVLETSEELGVVARDLGTGKISKVSPEEFQRPFFPMLMERDARQMAELSRMARAKPEWLSIRLFDPATKGVQPAVLDLEGLPWVSDMRAWLKQHVTLTAFPEYREENLRLVENLSNEELGRYAEKAVANRGLDGLVWAEEGFPAAVFIRDDGAALARHIVGGHPTIESQAFGPAAGSIADKWLYPTIDDVGRSMLRQAGVVERDMPYYMQMFKQQIRNHAMTLVDNETRQVVENASVAAAKLAGTESADQAIARAGFKLEPSSDGQVAISYDGAPIAKFADAEAARSYAKMVGVDESLPPLDMIPQQQVERIVATAVKDVDGNIRTGAPGENHAEIRTANTFRPGAQDGFVTDTGRFLSREEAYRVAQQSKQFKNVYDFGVRKQQLITEETQGLGAAKEPPPAPEEPNLIGMEVPTQAPPPQVPTDMAPAAAGGDARPPLFQEQLLDRQPGFWLRVKRALADWAVRAVAIENFAKNAENLGHGPAYTGIYMRVDKALKQVSFDLAEVKRTELGGRSYEEAIHGISKMLWKLPKARQEAIVNYIEAMSRQEILEPGGLLQRGLNSNEQRIADGIRGMYTKNMIRPVPYLMTLNRLAKTAVEQGQQGLERAQMMAGAYARSPEKVELYATLAREAPKTIEDALKLMKVNDVERMIIKILDEQASIGKSKFSIMAIARYAEAPELKAGFKSMREQFASEMAMTPQELHIAKEIDSILSSTFKHAGLDPKRAIGGYWPHLRQWVQHGNDLADIPGIEAMPDELKWSAMRVRTGELDVYDKDPLMTTFKHVRSMLMKEHFDPILPEVRKAMNEIAVRDPRTKRFMEEYVTEAMGKPHESFTHLEQAFQHFADTMGFKMPDRFAELTVNTLVSLASAAAIPFRPALIARNYFQMVQMVGPRVGMSYFFRALKYCIEPSTRDQAFELAVKVGAVPVDRLPIHAGSEIFGPKASWIPYHYQLIFKKGFGWYQSADDLGRAVAFYAQRMRIADNLPAYMEGRISLQKFLEQSKVLTYDPQDQKVFLDLMKRGMYEDAKNHLGNVLQRESIFRYGHANHPAGWGSWPGRLFGQFGTWPIQYKDFLIQGLTRGTIKDRVEFAALHGAINVGVVAAGAGIGTNLMSWVSFPSLAYNGGPYADVAVNAYQALGGSPEERSMALRNLGRLFPTLNNPRSIFIPGSYLAGDIADAFKNQNPANVLGFKLYKPGQKTHFEWLFGD